MKTSNNKTKNSHEPAGPSFQIVIKLKGSLSIPDSHKTEINDNIIARILFQAAIPETKVERLFTSLSAEHIAGLVENAKNFDNEYQPPDFFLYYVISFAAENDRQVVLQNLATHENVEWAYTINESLPPNVSPHNYDVLGMQRYLGSAPVGINAEYAWQIKGGNGEGNIKFVDVEQGWILDHESTSVNVLPSTGLNHEFHDHGTGVLGIITMANNGSTRSGITPRSKGFVMSQWRSDGSFNSADAIMAALVHLSFGDIILLETQVVGPSPSKKLWPPEIHTAEFDVIRLATALGIIVVEPAANGSVYFNLSNDLDYFVLKGKNIFNRESQDFRDSGAIMVAGASASAPHTRIYNSNYGSRIDCYAWGENVFTAGNFPNSSDGAIDRYTTRFSGTSSAAAIIAGVAISVQSIMEANLNFRLGPAEMRKILSSESYGTPSANGRSVDKIGIMPDLKKIIDNILFERAERAE